MENLFFSSWADLLRVVIVGASAYVCLVSILRISGKRTLSKLNAFDLVVTVALGSTLASALTSKSLSIAEVLAAFALLAGLQFVVSWLTVRSRAFDRLIKSEPTLLVRRGELLRKAMRRERIAEDEVLAAIRAAGGADLAAADSVILESDGSLTAMVTGAPARGSV
jgi:uncharacterized membrane protein YcaP (DUF421 family)